MGCGGSRTKKNERPPMSKEENKLLTDPQRDDRNAIKAIIPLDNYQTLQKNGFLFIDMVNLVTNFILLPCNDNIDIDKVKGDSFNLLIGNDTSLFFRYIPNDKIEKTMSSPENLLNLREKLKTLGGDHIELGINYEKKGKCDLVLCLIHFKNQFPQYLNHLSTLIRSNKLKHLELTDLYDDLFTLSEFVGAFHPHLRENRSITKISIKTNKLVSNVELENGPFSFNTSLAKLMVSMIINNLSTNSSIEKLKLNDLSIDDLNVYSNFFSSNRSISNLNFDRNPIESFDILKHVPLSSLNINNNNADYTSSLSENVINKNVNKLNKLKMSKSLFIKDESQFNLILNPNGKFSFLTNLTHLDISFNFINFETLSEFIISSNKIRKLNMQRPHIDEADIKVINGIKSFGKAYMTSTSLSWLGINFKSEECLAALAGGMGNIPQQITSNNKTFKLYKSHIKSVELFTQLAKLKEVDLSHCTFENFTKLCESLKSSKTCEILNLSSCNLKENEFIQLSEQLIFPNQSIISLNLDNNTISDNIVNQLAIGLSNSKSIKKLNLNFCFTLSISNSNLIGPFSIFCEKTIMKNLEEISMENCEFPPTSFGKDFSKFLEKNCSVKILKLGSIDEIFKQSVNSEILLAFMKYNKTLENLSLKNIKLMPVTLSEFLSNFDNKLKNITLDNTCSNLSFFEEMNKNTSIMKSLESFHISIYSINSDNDVEGIKQFLIKNAKLQNFKLNIKIKNIKPDHLEKIIEGIENNKILKIFDLTFDDALNRAVLLPEYERAIEKYYQYVNTCASLEKINLFFIKKIDTEDPLTNLQKPESDVSVVRCKSGNGITNFDELFEKGKTILNDFIDNIK
jgi:hypothetical protein